MKIKAKQLYLIGAVVILVAIIGLAYGVLTGAFSNNVPSGEYDDFAKCLTEKGATIYKAYWCGHCNNQKAMFGDSFKYINSVECDPKGDNAKPELCTQNNIRGYPTWIINGTHYEGEQSLQTLSSLTGCSLP
jgi:hypothetical protein